MAPSPAPEASTDSGRVPNSANGLSADRTQQQTATAVGQRVSKEGTSKAVNGTKAQPKAIDTLKDGKPTNKELKEKAKAEKAARRAQEKQKQQGQPVADLQGGNTAEEKRKETGRRGSTTIRATPAASSGQHKRSGSTSQKTLPTRPVEGQAASALEDPKKEEKRVALLDHLYGHPRRTTLLGAGKDVHPAVLALGLQMSNYVICGSTARCVATLLVFKQVSLSKYTSKLLLLMYLDHRILFYSLSYLAYPPPYHPPLFPNRVLGFMPSNLCVYGERHQMAEGRNLRSGR